MCFKIKNMSFGIRCKLEFQYYHPQTIILKNLLVFIQKIELVILLIKLSYELGKVHRPHGTLYGASTYLENCC